MHIRRAHPDEAEALTNLIRRSKAYWGYSQEMLDGWRSQLSISAETIARDPVYCAEADGRLAGVMHLMMLSASEALLEDLFIDPTFIGTGVGAALWHQAVAQAHALGATTMVLDADPNAQPFYEHMGATVISWSESPTSAGRRLPRMRYDLERM